MLDINRLAVIAGLRTPQAKAFGKLASLSAVDLGVHAALGLLQRTGLRPHDVDEVIFGNVAGPPDAANIARVIALGVGVPHNRIAHTVNRNCASGMEAIISAWQAIRDGRSSLVLAGGTESMSNIPWIASDRLKQKLLAAARCKSFASKLRAWTRLRLSDFKLIPGIQLGLTDPTCNLNMGETAERLADEFSVTREEQDVFAVDSHRKAVAASKRCFLSGEIHPLDVGGSSLTLDVGPRANQSLEQLGKLKPIFKTDGSVTAGNGCPLTDGAAAMLLTDERRAVEMGLQPLGFVRDYACAGCDPSRMGLGPVFATAKLLHKTGMSLGDFDLFEINEAFAAQTIACLRAFESTEFAHKELGLEAAMGRIDSEKLNVHGGAIALGHPIGASGMRIVLTLLRALRERGLRRGLATLCVGGGQGVAMVVEAE